MAGNGGADVSVFRAAQATDDDVVNDFGRADGAVRLVGFGGAFDAMASLDQTAKGTVLDRGGDSVLFLGRLVADFAADDFVLV